MFLDELKKDDMVFDGKNKQVLRKYALKLKNTLKDINAERAAQGLGPLEKPEGKVSWRTKLKRKAESANKELQKEKKSMNEEKAAKKSKTK